MSLMGELLKTLMARDEAALLKGVCCGAHPAPPFRAT